MQETSVITYLMDFTIITYSHEQMKYKNMQLCMLLLP